MKKNQKTTSNSKRLTSPKKTFNSNNKLRLSKTGVLEDFRKSDKMVDYVFIKGKELFENDLDRVSEAWLLRTGGRLTGALSYFGQKSARARAERDVFLHNKEELSGKLMLTLLDNSYKVTEARAKIKEEIADIEIACIEKECEKNQWENITTATQTMITFIQSTLKIKRSERSKGKEQYENN